MRAATKGFGQGQKCYASVHAGFSQCILAPRQSPGSYFCPHALSSSFLPFLFVNRVYEMDHLLSGLFLPSVDRSWQSE